jgi:hypothetical protein
MFSWNDVQKTVTRVLAKMCDVQARFHYFIHRKSLMAQTDLNSKSIFLKVNTDQRYINAELKSATHLWKRCYLDDPMPLIGTSESEYRCVYEGDFPFCDS